MKDCIGLQLRQVGMEAAPEPPSHKALLGKEWSAAPNKSTNAWLDCNREHSSFIPISQGTCTFVERSVVVHFDSH